MSDRSDRDTEELLVKVLKSLSSNRLDLKQEATRILTNCSLNSQLHPFFTKLNIGTQLLQLISHTNADVSKNVCVALINLCANPNFILNLLDEKPFEIILKQIRNSITSAPNIHLLFKILVNLSQTGDGRSELLQENSSLQGLHVIRLIHMLKRVDLNDLRSLTQFHYLPNVLCNIARAQIGRQLLMDPKRNLLRYVIPFMDERRLNYDYGSQSQSSNDSNNNNNNNNDNQEIGSIGEMYRIFHRGIWCTIRNCIWILNDSPQLLLRQMLKIQSTQQQPQPQPQQQFAANSSSNTNSNNDMLTDAEIMFWNDFILKIFLDIGITDELRKNHLMYELMNPVLSSILEYQPKLRKQLKHQHALKRFMQFDKLRFVDPMVHEMALECLHLIVGVQDQPQTFHSQSSILQLLNELKITELLQEYEIWQHDEELSAVSGRVRTTFGFQIEKVMQKKSLQNKTNNDHDSKQEMVDVDNDNAREEEKSGIKFEPIKQEFHHYKNTKKRKIFTKEQSTSFVDLILNTNTSATSTTNTSTVESPNNSNITSNTNSGASASASTSASASNEQKTDHIAT